MMGSNPNETLNIYQLFVFVIEFLIPEFGHIQHVIIEKTKQVLQ